MAEQPLEADLDTATNRRSLKHFFVKPKFGVPFVKYFVAGGLLTIGSTVALMHLRMGQIDTLLNDPQALRAGGHLPIYDAFADITTIGLIGLSVFIVYAIVVAMIFSHRVSGPMAALVDCIEQIQKGNLNYERRLRKGDTLHPVHDALQDLSRSLKEQRNEAAG